jgi:hypothetical protein
MWIIGGIKILEICDKNILVYDSHFGDLVKRQKRKNYELYDDKTSQYKY